MNKLKTRLIACAALLSFSLSVCHAATPSMPQIKLIADSGKATFGSAHTPGVNAFDLASAAYIEEEYYLSGKANARDEAGVVIAADEPYTTRFIIRKPTNIKKFSGNVIVTPFNWDRESQREWGFTKSTLTNHGDVFIGLSIVKQEITGFPLIHGIKMLQAYDAARYGSLSVYDDNNGKRQEMSQSQDILAQLAFLLKSNGATSPLKGMNVKTVIGYSLGVGGPVLERYIAQGRHNEMRTANNKPLFDGYIVGANSNLPVPPEATRADAVFVVIQNEREFSRDNVAKLDIPADSDTPKFRLYDFVGSPHLGKVVTNEITGESELGNDTPEIAKAARPRGVTAEICNSHNNAPVGVVQSALLDGVIHWVRQSKAMPRAARVELAGLGLGEKIDVETGNALGGLRPPWITVPAATYYTGASQGCGVWEPMKMYSAEKLNALYGNYDNYAKKFAAAKAQAVKDRFMLAESVAGMKPIATPENFVAK